MTVKNHSRSGRQSTEFHQTKKKIKNEGVKNEGEKKSHLMSKP